MEITAEPIDGVYFISDQHGHVKIGKAQDPYKRLKQLQTGNPYELLLIEYFPFYNGLLLEYALHDLFSKFQIRDEWFEQEPVEMWLNWICTQDSFSVGTFKIVHTQEFWDLYPCEPQYKNISFEKYAEEYKKYKESKCLKHSK